MSERNKRSIPWIERYNPSDYGIEVPSDSIAPVFIKRIPRIHFDLPQFDIRSYPTWVTVFYKEEQLRVVAKRKEEDAYDSYTGILTFEEPSLLRYQVINNDGNIGVDILKNPLPERLYPQGLIARDNLVLWDLSPLNSRDAIIVISHTYGSGWTPNNLSLLKSNYIVSGNGTRGGVFRDILVHSAENIPFEHLVNWK